MEHIKTKFLLSFLLLSIAVAARNIEPKDSAVTETQQRLNLHFQTTYIYQYKPSFNSPYSGVHSLSGNTEKENSLTATLFLGIRLWKDAVFFFNPEIAGGNGLSGSYGLSASTNGETYRVGNPSPTLYIARAYIMQTIALSKDRAIIADAANQLSVLMPKDYLQFQLGKYCLGDILDNNLYSNSPRTQFMNWAIMNNAAWDYAADVRGYTNAFAAILRLNDFTYKTSLAFLPVTANSAELNSNLGKEYAINSEIDKTYQMNGRSGNIRVLGYYNYGNFGQYKRALVDAGNAGGVPNVIQTREASGHKIGFGISADQQLSGTVGVFARLGANDGKTETWIYTEADETLSAGISVNGRKWHRKEDNIGFAIVVDGLSKEHKDYLAAGGLGFELGDGKLNYGYEKAAEWYYSFKPGNSPISLSVNYQFVIDPGYNKDRGPVNVFSFRFHVEF
jgi:high affinity Mn2+ porin